MLGTILTLHGYKKSVKNSTVFLKNLSYTIQSLVVNEFYIKQSTYLMWIYIFQYIYLTVTILFN